MFRVISQKKMLESNGGYKVPAYAHDINGNVRYLGKVEVEERYKHYLSQPYFVVAYFDGKAIWNN